MKYIWNQAILGCELLMCSPRNLSKKANLKLCGLPGPNGRDVKRGSMPLLRRIMEIASANILVTVLVARDASKNDIELKNLQQYFLPNPLAD